MKIGFMQGRLLFRKKMQLIFSLEKLKFEINIMNSINLQIMEWTINSENIKKSFI